VKKKLTNFLEVYEIIANFAGNEYSSLAGIETSLVKGDLCGQFLACSHE
jgi:hypothetical protein